MRAGTPLPPAFPRELRRGPLPLLGTLVAFGAWGNHPGGAGSGRWERRECGCEGEGVHARSISGKKRCLKCVLNSQVVGSPVILCLLLPSLKISDCLCIYHMTADHTPGGK